MTAAETAKKMAAAVSDEAASLLGITLTEVEPGRAVTTMTVRSDMLNGAKTCHGGIIFALADTALGFASWSRGKTAMAQNAQIHWLRPAKVGDRLRAVCTEIAEAGRSNIFDIEVTNQDGATVATLRGVTRVVSDTQPIS